MTVTWQPDLSFNQAGNLTQPRLVASTNRRSRPQQTFAGVATGQPGNHESAVGGGPWPVVAADSMRTIWPTNLLYAYSHVRFQIFNARILRHGRSIFVRYFMNAEKSSIICTINHR
jgi:hypothetical protein